MQKKFFRYLPLIFLLVYASTTVAQSAKPVIWTFQVTKVSDKEYDLVFLAGIKKGLHIYSQHIGEGGPIPTSFMFNKDGNYALEDSVTENFNTPIKLHDKMFDMDLIFYEDSAMFIQRIKVTGKTSSVSGTLEYMACDSKKCFPPQKVDFTFKLPD